MGDLGDGALSRRDWLTMVGATGAGALLPFPPLGVTPATGAVPAADPIVALSSSSEVFIPPRGDGFMKWSFDSPEPSVAFEGLRIGFKVFSRENAYALDREKMTVESTDGGLRLICSGLRGSGGQEAAPGRLVAEFRKHESGVEWEVAAELPQPVKAVTAIVRGIPRGKISSAGNTPFDPRDNELLFGYPFSGGDLFGANTAQGMGTPLIIVESGTGEHHSLSSLDDRVRTKRMYFQPGEGGYRVELIHETEGWLDQPRVQVPAWRVGRAESLGAAVEAHYQHLERAYAIPRWDRRDDVPAWLRRTELVLALHGMHYSGYVFNTFPRMLEILRWIAPRIPAERVLVFLPAWDGRYYWDYPRYRAAERLGGEGEFHRLIQEGKQLGFRFMPMFGANAANRRLPEFAGLADAATAKVDGDRFDLNWVDWDNDRHQEGWLAYMNLGVESWRRRLTERITDAIERYDVDAYFLDIVAGWTNNTSADMHEGTRRLVTELRTRHPQVLACGEFHYDALLGFIPFYHVHSPHAVPYARFFSHLSHPAPGRGSSGVHESGFSRWDPATLSLPKREGLIPTLSVVDDTFDRYRDEMAAVIAEARVRAGSG